MRETALRGNIYLPYQKTYLPFIILYAVNKIEKGNTTVVDMLVLLPLF